MFDELLFALWFFLPAGLANMAPVPVAKLPVFRRFDAPLDFGATFRGRRLFGSHKTWRGLIAGVIVAILVVWLQQYLVKKYGWFTAQAQAADYMAMPAVLLGLAFAIGALGGDAVESFFKRQRNIRPGGVWFPFDIIDHIVGAILVTLPFIVFSWGVYFIVVLIWMAGNLLVSYAAYFVSLKERPI